MREQTRRFRPPPCANELVMQLHFSGVRGRQALCCFNVRIKRVQEQALTQQFDAFASF